VVTHHEIHDPSRPPVVAVVHAHHPALRPLLQDIPAQSPAKLEVDGPHKQTRLLVDHQIHDPSGFEVAKQVEHTRAQGSVPGDTRQIDPFGFRWHAATPVARAAATGFAQRLPDRGPVPACPVPRSEQSQRIARSYARRNLVQ
jgi:hypothetical protein